MFIKSRIGWQALTKKEYLETGDYYLITGTDIDEDKHIVDFNCCYYVSKERYEMDDKIQVYEGDIIVTKDGTIGKVAMVTGLDKPATLNSHLFVLRDLSGKLYNRFLLQVLVSHIFGDFVESTKTGSTLTGLPQKTFVEFRFLMPEMDEQMKIAQYLDNLDNLITLHQRKYNKLLNVKKSMLEKMFPKNGSNIPEIRFKGFTDPWERRKLGEYVSITSGEAPSKFEEGTELYVKVDDLNYNDKYVVDTQNKVAEHSTVKRVTKGSVVFPKRGAAIMTNKVRILGIDSYMDTNMMALTSERLDSEFLYNIISKEGLYKIADTSTIPQINNKHIEPYEVKIPSLDEQRRIGVYFKQLDNLITLHQRELEKLQNIKKSMLEKMFV